jgi:hypothetical protein
MKLVLLIAMGWTALSLAALPLVARLFRPHLACRAGIMHRCRNYAACAASRRCLQAPP